MTNPATMNISPEVASREALKPCPFCTAGETQVIPKTMWMGGMRPSQPISTTVRHWCHRPEGQPQSHIDIVGRDTDSAIEAWNRRAPDTGARETALDMDQWAVDFDMLARYVGLSLNSMPIQQALILRKLGKLFAQACPERVPEIFHGWLKESAESWLAFATKTTDAATETKQEQP